ncbi:MAG: hypothetical protein LBS74_09545 [Oscillospiraceae bacterium]|jgi:stage III sporulation protein AG|nr:hypothetical protein [Oscillospiraceae bacterium]
MKASDYLKKGQELLRHPKAKNILIILALLGAALIFLSDVMPFKSKSAVTQPKAGVSAESFEKELESKLSAMICSISGVGEAKVMITLESGVEYVFANEEKSNTNYTADGSRTDEKSNTEKKLILVDGQNGNKEALVQTELQPKVKGVVIVCEGGDNPTVQQRLIQVVTTALDISSKRVCVTRLS